MNTLIRYGTILALIFCSGPLFAQQLELQSRNPGFWDSSQNGNWQSNSGANVSDSGSLILNGSDQGAWQVVPINLRSEQHLLSIKAVHQSLDGASTTFAGFGVNYYDRDFDFISSKERNLPVTVNSSTVSTPDFDNVTPTTLGTRIPVNARFAVIWIWNVGANGVTYADNFGLYNYFQIGSSTYQANQIPGNRFSEIRPEFRNVVTNGFTDFRGIADLADQQFYPNRPNGDSELLPEFSGDDFWTATNPYNGSVQPYRLTGSFRLGNFVDDGVVWQQIDLEPNTRYSFRTLVDSFVIAGPFRLALESHWGTVGVDFYDANWNEIGEATLSTLGGPRLSDFTTPPGTRFSTVWIWNPAARETEQFSGVFETVYTQLDVREIEIKKFEPSDFAPKVRLLSQPPKMTREPLGPISVALFAQGKPGVSFPPGGVGGDVTISGPGGEFNIYYITGGPKGDGIWELIYATWKGPGNIPVNGIYEIRVAERFAEQNGVPTPETVVGFLEVDIPQD